MVPQYSARFIPHTGRLELVMFDASYLADRGGVEFWADVYNHETEETVILTGSYFEPWGDLEYVWLDHERLLPGHPLRKAIEYDKELLAACERAWQHARFQALEELI